jgi:hypothetical protein
LILKRYKQQAWNFAVEGIMTDKTLDEAAVAAAWNRNAELWAQEVRAGFDFYRELYTLPALNSCHRLRESR